MLSTRSLLCLVAFSALLAGCTCAGCGDWFSWSADLPRGLDHDDVRALEARACRNGACVEGRLEDLEVDDFVALSDPAAPHEPGARVSLQRAVDGSFRVSLSWDVRDAEDGDRYLVEITDPSGALIVGLEERPVDYQGYRANGPLDPKVCRHASLDVPRADAGP